MFVCPVDRDEAVRSASTHGSGDSSLFESALSFLHSDSVRCYSSTLHHPCVQSEIAGQEEGAHRRGRHPGSARQGVQPGQRLLPRSILARRCRRDAGAQAVHLWRRVQAPAAVLRWRHADAAHLDGHGRGVKHVRQVWRHGLWEQAGRGQLSCHDGHETSHKISVLGYDWG
jgi:hypothetical protein